MFFANPEGYQRAFLLCAAVIAAAPVCLIGAVIYWLA
jgi:hypothetical protein